MKEKQPTLIVYPEKIVPLFLMILILGAGLWIYGKNKEFIANFKAYYLVSYKEALQYKIGELPGLVFNPKNSKAEGPTESEYAESIPVITYHGIISSYPDGSNVSVDKFSDQMIKLKKAGYQTISMQDYYDFIYNGKKLAKKSFLLTFDDGRKDAYYPAEPILRALGYRAVMFVITGESFGKESRFYLSQTELAKMKESGHWDLEVHTKNGHSFYPIDNVNGGHYYTNKLWVAKENRLENDQEFKDRITGDLVGGKKDLQLKMGVDPVAFAFPFGDIGDDETNYPQGRDILMQAVSANYPLAFYQFWPGRGYSANYLGTKTFLNNRIQVLPDWNGDKVLATLELASAKDLPYSDKFDSNKGWLTSWGDVYFQNGKLITKSTNRSSNANIYLDGTLLWKDYLVKTNIRAMNGATVRIIVRRKDGGKYAACAYSKDHIWLEQNLNGTPVVIAEKTTPGINGDVAVAVGTNVIAGSISCSFQNEPVLSMSNLSSELDFGGVGFEIWGQENNNWAEINSIEITPAK